MWLGKVSLAKVLGACESVPWNESPVGCGGLVPYRCLQDLFGIDFFFLVWGGLGWKGSSCRTRWKEVEGDVKEMMCIGATENLKRIAKWSEKNYNKKGWGCGQPRGSGLLRYLESF